ncbi:acyl carrier protein [Marinomonas aquiplantarum]|uniref:Acyl carrier protein n=1 Tax=Marinomonas aquiplantarum TaxID=491951 RepID=A0A366D6R4_9GAMM|nr:acyl carrier protein [Marinomonas aquiplantarum]RBO85741.1 acyl carrier protein [Marinomonas aquiplantarum]
MINNEKLIDILVKSGVDVEKENIHAEQSFEDMGLDSLDMFNFFTEIDEQLGVEIPDDDFEGMNNLDEVRLYLVSKLDG